MIKIGDIYEHKFTFKQEDVNTFAKVTGDNNPIHLDEEYAKKTIFKKRIVHGFLAGSIFSKVFGTLYPGEGTIYLKQSMKFMAPIYTENEYTATFEISSIDELRKRAVVITSISDSSTNVVLVGEALIQNNEKI